MSDTELPDIGCVEAQAAIERIGDGRLGRTSWSRLRRHLQSCPECRRSFALMQAAVDALEGMERQRAPEGFRKAVLGEVFEGENAAAGRVVHKSGHGGSLIAVAAGMGIAIAVGVAIARRLAARAPLMPGGDEDTGALGPASV